MSRRFLIVGAALVSVIGSSPLSPLVLADQSAAVQSRAASALRLTADGQPDLQGFWTPTLRSSGPWSWLGRNSSPERKRPPS